MDQPENIVVVFDAVRPDAGSAGSATGGDVARVTEALAATHEIVELAGFRERSPAEHGLALLTFDGGLRSQLACAAELDRLGLRGVFFAPMRPIASEADGWCTPHLLHALAFRLGWGSLRVEMERRLGLGPLGGSDAAHDAIAQSLLELVISSLEADAAGGVLRDLASETGLDHRAWYMDADDLIALQDAGHAVGSMGYDLVPPASLGEGDQLEDLLLAHHWVTSILGEATRPMAMPLGRRDAHAEQVARRLGHVPILGPGDRIPATDIPALCAAGAAALAM